MKSSKYKVVICPPCGEQSLAPEGFNPGVAQAAKEGQNRKNALWPLLPSLSAVLPPQGREMFHGFTQSCHPEFISGSSRYNNKMLKQVQHDGIKGFTRSVTPQGRYAGYSGRIGFTLIELLVVVLIIGILAAVALPQYQKAVKKAQGREVFVALNALERGIASHYLETGYMPAGFQPMSKAVEVPVLKHWKYGRDSQTGECTQQQNSSSHSSSLAALGLFNNLDICLNGHVKDLYVRTSWEKGHLRSATCIGHLNSPTCADYFDGCPPVQKLEGLMCGEEITYYESRCTLK